MSEPTMREMWFAFEAYKAGYGRGHNDTVEACYNPLYEHENDAAIDWWTDAYADADCFAAAPKPDDELERCAWTEQENGPWETSCGEAWEFFEGGPSENRAHFCLYCGKPIKERLFVFPLEQSDE